MTDEPPESGNTGQTAPTVLADSGSSAELRERPLRRHVVDRENARWLLVSRTCALGMCYRNSMCSKSGQKVVELLGDEGQQLCAWTFCCTVASRVGF